MRTLLLAFLVSGYTEGVDFFLSDWSRDNNWIIPPFLLIGRILRKLLDNRRAIAILAIPVWKGRQWWAVVAPDGRHLADFVTNAGARTSSSLARLRAIASPRPPPNGASSRYASTSGLALAPFRGRGATSTASSKRGV